MAETQTLAIRSWKDPSQRWIINADDFDESRHTRWGEPMTPESKPEPAPHQERVHTPLRPSAPDFILDEQGNIASVNIINPDQRSARKEIPFGDYDPDVHELWSSHSRFQ